MDQFEQTGWYPAHNRQLLALFLTMQAQTFPSSPQYNAGKWDKRADFWEKERRLQRKDDERVTATLEFLTGKGILTPDCRIADIGCGPGRFAAAFARQCGSVTGFDLSEKMVEYGNAYIQGQGLTNARLHCCDFGNLDIRREGYEKAFDLVFASMTPAIHNATGLRKAMEMSRAWCLNISHVRRNNHLRQRMLAEVFHSSPQNQTEGRAFYTLFNILFLMGYEPETSFVTRRKVSRVLPDGEYVDYLLEHSLPLEEHTPENAEKILRWLQTQTEEDGLVTEVSDAVYGRILWNVNQTCQRPEYHALHSQEE